MAERFGPYTVHECLGAGGMAAVHRASIDIGAGVTREVALKRLLPQLADDKKLVEDFIREAKLAAQLRHPNIVRILELGHTDRRYFIAMELVHGRSLLQLLKIANAKPRPGATRNGPSIGIIVALLAELCDALDYASNATDADGSPLHIVHRDLSPSNLIVTVDGHVKIIDFGVAKAVSGRFMTNTGMIKGKLGYMAIEVITGQPVDRRTDIFSLGVVAWELITGRRLFTGPNEIETIKAVRRGAFRTPSEFNSACPPELDEIVMHALAREREDRWPGALEMGRALASVRRTHQGGPRDVVAWMRSLLEPQSEARPTVPMTATMNLSLDDLVESSANNAPVSFAAEGSGRSGPPHRPSESTLVTARTVRAMTAEGSELRPTVPVERVVLDERLSTAPIHSDESELTSIETTPVEAVGETTDVVDIPPRPPTQPDDDPRKTVQFRTPTLRDDEPMRELELDD